MRLAAESESDIATVGVPLDEQVPIARDHHPSGLQHLFDSRPPSRGNLDLPEAITQQPNYDEAELSEEAWMFEAAGESRSSAVGASRDVFVGSQDREEVDDARDERISLFGIEVLVSVLEPAIDRETLRLGKFVHLGQKLGCVREAQCAGEACAEEVDG